MDSAGRHFEQTACVVIAIVVWSLAFFIGLRLTGDAGSLDH